MVLEKTLESLDCKRIKLVNLKGNQPWTFTARTVAEAEAPIIWLLDSKSQLIGKDWMLRKIEDKRRKAWQRMRWLDGITNSTTWIWDKFWAIMEDRGVRHAIVHGVAKSRTCLSDWTTTDISALPWFSASSQAILSASLPPSTSHTAGDFLSFKTQVKCHLSMAFPNSHPTSSHSNLGRWTVPLTHVCCTLPYSIFVNLCTYSTRTWAPWGKHFLKSIQKLIQINENLTIHRGNWEVMQVLYQVLSLLKFSSSWIFYINVDFILTIALKHCLPWLLSLPMPL